MRKLFSFFAIVFMLLTSVVIVPQTSEAAPARRPVGFVVMDHTGQVDGSMYKYMRAMVKIPFSYPEYIVAEGGLPQQVVSDVLRDNVKVDKKLMAVLAEKSKVDVLVVARIYAMNQEIVHGWFGRWDDHEDYVLTEASADFYVYKKDCDKFMKKNLREREIREFGASESPKEQIYKALKRIVRDMEDND